jgi:hypothetical protein
MDKTVQVVLFGSLRNTSMDSSNPSVRIQTVVERTPIKDVIRQADIQDDKVQLVMRNHRAISKDAVINPGDRLALFPVEYPIYPDWNDFRF